jgi:CRP/FNR family transcriptional regulator, cyclic AMP receptor protein
MLRDMHWPLLDTLDEAERERLLSTCRRRRFRRGEVLFHEGDATDSVHVLVSGRAAIGIVTADGDEATLGVVGEGATFGEVSLVAHPPVRSATVTALEPCETLSLRGPEFDRLRREHPAVERMLLEQLALQVRRLSTQLVEALYVPADRRVLRRLVDLTELYDDGTGTAKVMVTQSMLASIAGTSRVTANQALHKASSRGCVELARGYIHVLDRDGLARLAR